MRTMIELSLFDALSGVDPATAHLHRPSDDDDDDDRSTGGGGVGPPYHQHRVFAFTSRQNVRRITRGVLRLFCAVAQIVPCPAQPQVLLRPAMGLLRKRYVRCW